MVVAYPSKILFDSPEICRVSSFLTAEFSCTNTMFISKRKKKLLRTWESTKSVRFELMFFFSTLLVVYATKSSFKWHRKKNTLFSLNQVCDPFYFRPFRKCIFFFGMLTCDFLRLLLSSFQLIPFTKENTKCPIRVCVCVYACIASWVCEN